MAADTQTTLPAAKPTQERIVAVVVTFNRRTQIVQTLARLREEGLDAIVVIDNGSTDGTREWLAAQTDGALRVVLTDANLGGAGGFALGMRTAMEDFDPSWLVLMDDDARPAPGALARFRNLAPGRWDAVAAAVLYPSGAICDMNRPLRNPFRSLGALFRSLFDKEGHGFRLPDSAYKTDALPQKVEMASFVGFFVSADAVRHVGVPDPRLFLYGDDQLYALRLTQAGLHLGFEPAVQFEHDCETLVRGVRTYTPVWKAYYTYRNGILVYRGAAGSLAWLILALRIPKWWFAARHYGDEAPAYRRLLRKALSDGIRGRLDAPPEGIPAPPK